MGAAASRLAGHRSLSALASRRGLLRAALIAPAAVRLGAVGPAAAQSQTGTAVVPAAAPGAPAAALAPDWDVPGGRFYTQTAPEGAEADTGYVVADGEGYALWRDYARLGGPAQLGYPVTARFEADGNVYQLTQAALLHWNPNSGRAELFPVFAGLQELELDGWLEGLGVPSTSPDLVEDPGLAAETRLTWLTHPTLAAAYRGAGEDWARDRFGLPMGEPERRGPYLAQRFDKAVLQLWLDEVPGQPAPGTVTQVQLPELLRAAELVPEEAFAPQTAPAPRPKPPEPAIPPRALVVAGSDPVGLAEAIGGKYIAVSVGRQWWWAYEGGRLLNSGAVTTGRPELYTPVGRYTILSKHSPFTFVSPWPPGSPYWYETATSSFALRITGNGIYLHDAPWRPYYGPGTNVPHTDPDGVWRTGSHGCINMPLAAARWAYGWAPVGMPVDVIA